MNTKLLYKPYPFIESPVVRFLLAIVMGLVVFLLLNTYRPFGIELIPKTETAYVAGFGVMAFVSILTSLFIFPLLFDIKSWTIKSEVSLHIFNWLLTSTLSYVYNNTVIIDLAPQYSLTKFIFIVAATYLVPLLAMIVFTEKYFKYHNEQAALALQDNMDETGSLAPKENSLLKIQPETSKSPSIALATNKFIFAASDGNYVILHYLDTDGNPSKKLVRLSLKNLEKQIQEHKEIIRCHKSYLVNRMHIKEVSGNARSLYLNLTHVDIKVPVSRSFDRSLLG